MLIKEGKIWIDVKMILKQSQFMRGFWCMAFSPNQFSSY